MSVTLIQTQNVSSATSVVFDTGISSPLNNYMVIYQNVTYDNSVDSKYIRLQISTNGGSSYISTNYLDFTGNTDGVQCMSFSEANPGPSNVANSGTMYLYNMTSGSGYFLLQTSGAIYNDDVYTVGPQMQQDFGIGGYTVSGTTINAFRIGFSDGTSTISGTFSLYSIDS